MDLVMVVTTYACRRASICNYYEDTINKDAWNWTTMIPCPPYILPLPKYSHVMKTLKGKNAL